MKVVLFNGSPRPNGNTMLALQEIEKVLRDKNIETEILQIGNKPVRDCIACNGCVKTKKCVFDDDVANLWLDKVRHADGFIFGTPVYFAHASGRIQSIMDRMFYADKNAFCHKVGAVVSVARRAGTSFSQDNLNKYLLLSNVIIPGSSYWNVAFGREAGEVVRDEEGLQIMRNLARNMTYILKCLEAGTKSNILPPRLETNFHTNFIR